MRQTPETYYDAMPCDECGNTHMIQETKQSESVYLDDNGEIEHIEPRGYIEVQSLWCDGCDKKVWEE